MGTDAKLDRRPRPLRHGRHWGASLPVVRSEDQQAPSRQIPRRCYCYAAHAARLSDAGAYWKIRDGSGAENCPAN